MNINYSPSMIKAAAELKGINMQTLAVLLNTTEAALNQWTDASMLALEGPEPQEGKLEVSRLEKLYFLLGLALSDEQADGVRHLILPDTPIFYFDLSEPYSEFGEGDCKRLNALLKACQKVEFTYVEPRKKKMFGLKADANFIARFHFESEAVCYAIIKIQGSLFSGYGLNPEELPKSAWAPVGETVSLSPFLHEAAFMSKSLSATDIEEILAEKVEQEAPAAAITPSAVQASVSEKAPEEELDEQTLKLAKLLAAMVKSGQLDINTLTVKEAKNDQEPALSQIGFNRPIQNQAVQ